jgi:hypothetical protein
MAEVKALPVAACVPSESDLVANILACYSSATDEERSNGGDWYSYAHLFAAELGRGRVRMAAGVIAALSPQESWSENVKLAIRAFSTRGPSGQTGANVDKARRILLGDDPASVLGGPKVRAFYALILDPGNGWEVVVDRHALDIALNGHEVKAKWLERKGAYDLIGDAYRKAAAQLGLAPHQVQAITWLAHRRAKRTNVSTFSRFTVDHSVHDDGAD